MIFEPVCVQCKYYERHEIGYRKEDESVRLYQTSCKLRSPNFMTNDGCRQFEPKPIPGFELKEDEEG